jgi:hypothetical protein
MALALKKLFDGHIIMHVKGSPCIIVCWHLWGKVFPHFIAINISVRTNKNGVFKKLPFSMCWPYKQDF